MRENINAVNKTALVESFHCFSRICCKNPLKTISSLRGAKTTTAKNSKNPPNIDSGFNK